MRRRGKPHQPRQTQSPGVTSGKGSSNLQVIGFQHAEYSKWSAAVWNKPVFLLIGVLSGHDKLQLGSASSVST